MLIACGQTTRLLQLNNVCKRSGVTVLLKTE